MEYEENDEEDVKVVSVKEELEEFSAYMREGC
jgi:hypothetical protein